MATHPRSTPRRGPRGGTALTGALVVLALVDLIGVAWLAVAGDYMRHPMLGIAPSAQVVTVGTRMLWIGAIVAVALPVLAIGLAAGTRRTVAVVFWALMLAGGIWAAVAMTGPLRAGAGDTPRPAPSVRPTSCPTASAKPPTQASRPAGSPAVKPPAQPSRCAAVVRTGRRG